MKMKCFRDAKLCLVGRQNNRENDFCSNIVLLIAVMSCGCSEEKTKDRMLPFSIQSCHGSQSIFTLHQNKQRKVTPQTPLF